MPEQALRAPRVPNDSYAPAAADGGLPDAELVRQVRAGHPEAYRLLVRRHQDALYGYALRMTGSPVAAADLTQGALVRAHDWLGWCREPAHFGAWVMNIVRVDCLERLEEWVREGERRALEGADGAGPDTPAVPRAVAEALDFLPDDQRAAFVLKHVEGLPYEEVAERLGLSAEGVRARVHRARDTLEVLLKLAADTGGTL